MQLLGTSVQKVKRELSQSKHTKLCCRGFHYLWVHGNHTLTQPLCRHLRNFSPGTYQGNILSDRDHCLWSFSLKLGSIQSFTARLAFPLYFNSETDFQPDQDNYFYIDMIFIRFWSKPQFNDLHFKNVLFYCKPLRNPLFIYSICKALTLIHIDISHMYSNITNNMC